MGIASCLIGRARQWWAQGALVLGYTVVIAPRMRECLVHPLGPPSKNIAVRLRPWTLAVARRGR